VSVEGAAARAGAADARLGSFQPIRVRKAADEVIAVLVDAIRGGLYRPGEYLPRQADLAQRLEVSRAVLREGIDVLRRAGIVSVKRGNTGGVLIETTENLHQVLATIGGETHATIRAALEARRPLETAAALLAAARREPAALERLSALVEALEQVEDPDEFLPTDRMFHFALAELCGSPLLGQFLRSALDQVVRATAAFPFGRADTGQALLNQRRTLEAIVAGDPAQVRSALDEHLAMLEEAYLGERIAL
jgi:GntR family transcriptional repressor for pyruvate dehydrogenase complex